MAAQAHIKVRLPGYYVAALEMIASRHGEHEATWAGHALRAAIDTHLEHAGAREDAQAYYQAQLDEREGQRLAAATAPAPALHTPRRRRNRVAS